MKLFKRIVSTSLAWRVTGLFFLMASVWMLLLTLLLLNSSAFSILLIVIGWLLVLLCAALIFLVMCNFEQHIRLSQEPLLERYRNVFAISPDPILLLHDDGTVLDANRAALQMYRYDRDTLLAMHIQELYAPGARLPESGLLSDTLVEYETYHRQRDGAIVPVAISIYETFIFDEQLTILLVRDISRRLKMEEELESYRYNLELLVNSRTNELTAVNERLQREVVERSRLQQTLEDTNRQLRAEVIEKEARNREITLLSEMVAVLQSCLTTDEAYAVITLFVRRLFPGDVGALCIVKPGQPFVESVLVWGGALANERIFSPDDCWALRRGNVHMVKDPETGMGCSHLRAVPRAGYLCVPMVAQGETLGLLILANGEHELEYPEEQRSRRIEHKRRMAVALSEQVALALSNLMLRDTLRQQVVRDPLTGLFNRLYMEETLNREVRRASRHGTRLGLLMVDLDHFKEVNDSFGHEAGDTALREVGALLRSQIRGEDVPCRYGGEEFVLILPGANLTATHERADHIRDALKQMRVRHRGVLLRPLTASIGIATFPEHGTAPDVLMRIADRALYQAKQSGRDQVVIGNIVDDSV
jgi:diguanylate cyclase (GGDEF)-like protein/PAS domain S-box-containing protein